MEWPISVGSLRRCSVMNSSTSSAISIYVWVELCGESPWFLKSWRPSVPKCRYYFEVSGRPTRAYTGVFRSFASTLSESERACWMVYAGGPYLLMLLLFCLEPKRPCMIIKGAWPGSALEGSCRLYAKVRWRLKHTWYVQALRGKRSGSISHFTLYISHLNCCVGTQRQKTRLEKHVSVSMSIRAFTAGHSPEPTPWNSFSAPRLRASSGLFDSREPWYTGGVRTPHPSGIRFTPHPAKDHIQLQQLILINYIYGY